MLEWGTLVDSSYFEGYKNFMAECILQVVLKRIKLVHPNLDLSFILGSSIDETSEDVVMDDKIPVISKLEAKESAR